MKLIFKLTLVYVLFSIIPISIIGFITFEYGSKVITHRTEEQLKSIVVLKENALNTYLQQEVTHLASTARDPYFLDAFKLMLDNINQTDTHQMYHHTLQGYFSKKIEQQQDIKEYFILGKNGVVHLSTSPQQEGKIHDDMDYFIQGGKHNFIQGFYYSLAVQEPAVTISTPIINNDGEFLGVLAARININSISEIITERSGLEETGETILVNKYNLLVSKSHFIEGVEFKKRIYSDTVTDCIAGNANFAQYLDYRGVRVWGYYDWDAQREVCFIAKIDEVEALTPITELRNALFVMSLGMIAIFLLLGILLARTITIPILKLREATIKVSEGKLNTKIAATTKDEMGDLASAFRKMAVALKLSQEKVKRYTTGLEKQVKVRTQELEQSKELLERKVEQAKKTELATLNILEDVEESRKKLKELDVLKTNFLSTVSHELRTPITPIKSQVQRLLEKEIPSKEKKEALEMILRNTIRLDRLIQDILELSRIQSKRLTIFQRKEDILKLVEENIKTMNFLAKDAGVELILEHRPHTGEHYVWVDRDRIAEILINLLDNAIKYSGSKRIYIKMERRPTDILMSVIDKGVGIPETEQARIFEPFYRGMVGLERYPEGTGLGLSICKGIVESHGGKMWFETKFGKGTTFSFTLPIKKKGKIHNSKRK